MIPRPPHRFRRRVDRIHRRAHGNGRWKVGIRLGRRCGVLLALLALILAAPADPQDSARLLLGGWLTTNLGHSVWLFGLVLTLYVMNLRRLQQILADQPVLRDVVELDQLLDVWIHLFVGIGVIWTAVGMRSALQAALGEPGQALVDSAGSVLQKLVDGGILLALTTTIVGGIGGYLMRLGKTMVVGASLFRLLRGVPAHRSAQPDRDFPAHRIHARLSDLTSSGRPRVQGWLPS